MTADLTAAARQAAHLDNTHTGQQRCHGTMQPGPEIDLIDAFTEYFEVIPADNPELRTIAHRLRFDVYSREIRLPGFEEWRFPDRLEVDDHDPHSVQCLLRHKPTFAWAGVVRLILAPPTQTQKPFPVESCAAASLDNAKTANLPRQRTGEISRLILTREFRRRRGEAETRYGNSKILGSTDSRRRHFPHPLLGLMVCAMRMSVEHGITHWLAGMEPRLNRMLDRFGLQLTAIGPEIEYHGIRRPYLGRVYDVMENAYLTNRAVWDLLSDRGRLYPPPKARNP